MSRVYRTQKEYEQFLIRRYCTLLHYEISCPRWPDPPDALLTLRKGTSVMRVAIEHTSYFNDTEAGKCSPLTPLSEFWRHVEASLCRRISHRPHLADIVSGRLWLKIHLTVDGTNVALARQFAKELADFLETRPFTSRERIPPYLARPPITTFDGFPTLKSLIASMLISRIKGGHFSPRCSWMCNNLTTGCIGLDLNYIKTAISRKNKKATQYNWMSADERWLLIVAAGDTLSNNAGPPEQHVDWKDSMLNELCRESPFDKIIFWEYCRNWYKSLKPSRAIAKFK